MSSATNVVFIIIIVILLVGCVLLYSKYSTANNLNTQSQTTAANLQTQLTALQAQIANIQTKYANDQTTISNDAIQIQDLNTKLSNTANDVVDLQSLTTQVANYKSQIDSLTSQLADQVSTMKTNSDLISQYQSTISQNLFLSLQANDALLGKTSNPAILSALSDTTTKMISADGSIFCQLAKILGYQIYQSVLYQGTAGSERFCSAAIQKQVLDRLSSNPPSSFVDMVIAFYKAITAYYCNSPTPQNLNNMIGAFIQTLCSPTNEMKQLFTAMMQNLLYNFDVNYKAGSQLITQPPGYVSATGSSSGYYTLQPVGDFAIDKLISVAQIPDMFPQQPPNPPPNMILPSKITPAVATTIINNSSTAPTPMPAPTPFPPSPSPLPTPVNLPPSPSEVSSATYVSATDASTVCESAIPGFNVACPVGQNLTVRSAKFWHPQGGCQNPQPTCSGKDVTPALNSFINGNSLTIPNIPGINMFGDPCPNVGKQLDISYNCTSPNHSSAPITPMPVPTPPSMLQPTQPLLPPPTPAPAPTLASYRGHQTIFKHGYGGSFLGTDVTNICPPGSYVNNINGTLNTDVNNNYVTSIGYKCSDGSTFGPYGGKAGNYLNNVPFSIDAPPAGQYPVDGFTEMYGHSGEWIDNVMGYGGTGGTNYIEYCPDGQHLVGMTVNTDNNYVGGMQYICDGDKPNGVTLPTGNRGNGSLSPQYGYQGYTGTKGGSFTCLPGSYVNTITGTFNPDPKNNWVASLGLQCSDGKKFGPFGSNNSSYTPFTVVPQASSNGVNGFSQIHGHAGGWNDNVEGWGGAGGTPYNFVCPPGQHIVGANIDTDGNYLGGVQWDCDFN